MLEMCVKVKLNIHKKDNLSKKQQTRHAVLWHIYNRRRKWIGNTMIDIRDKIQTGGVMGLFHICVSIILSAVVVMQLDLSGKAILWNVLVFNLPAFLDFVHTFSCVPSEKIGKAFNCVLCVTIISLLISVILSGIGVGILLTGKDIYIKNTFRPFIGLGKVILRASILLNPVGILADYMCSILIEEHRIETRVEMNTN